MTAPDPAHVRIVDELKARGGGSTREIAARLSADEDETREQLAWLSRRKYVRYNGVLGVWWIASYSRGLDE